MPHVIPSSERDRHTLDMGCSCEPEIHFGATGIPTIVHRNVDDQVTVEVLDDPYYDKPRKSSNQNY